MRLTVNLDDDLYALAKSTASSEGTSISDVVNRLLRRSQIASPNTESRNGFPIIHCRTPLTPEQVDEVESRFL